MEYSLPRMKMWQHLSVSFSKIPTQYKDEAHVEDLHGLLQERPQRNQAVN